MNLFVLAVVMISITLISGFVLACLIGALIKASRAEEERLARLDYFSMHDAPFDAHDKSVDDRLTSD